MKVLVVGGGGREHAIVKKLSESNKISKLYAAPGNGGISKLAECVSIKATDIENICKFATEENIDFVVVTPDDPLVLGAVDALNAVGIRCFGPTANAAIIEGSKSFAKDLMGRYGIPTAKYMSFDDMEKALEYAKDQSFPLVIKADGLALGKGVIIATDIAEAEDAIKSIMEKKAFGNSGSRIVIEEFLSGVEVSVLAFTDGKTIVPMISSMDHKRAYDGDKGPNTGGMGVIAPNPFYDDNIAAECMSRIFLPTVNAMNKEGRTFKGCLYFGLMITDDGPKVIEYNCRFGDPETQCVLSLLESDLFDIMLAVEEGSLESADVRFSEESACCVVMASEGYPISYEKGFPISFNETEKLNNVFVYHAGTKEADGVTVTSGGRVLGVTAIADSLDDAINVAYSAVKRISFNGAFYRTDIGNTHRR